MKNEPMADQNFFKTLELYLSGNSQAGCPVTILGDWNNAVMTIHCQDTFIRPIKRNPPEDMMDACVRLVKEFKSR